tara:strand:+ start:1068 stop:1277 length:210 start_codon:yes stop_codon:yes gene_type:complete
MSIHDEKILELVSKTIYETTILCRVNEGDYYKHIGRIKNMLKMYAESYLDDYIDDIENTTSTENDNGDD